MVSYLSPLIQMRYLPISSWFCLNPYCSGQWSRTELFSSALCASTRVLILIVVDNGLVLCVLQKVRCTISSLNPYCSGQWSRTSQRIGTLYGSKNRVLILIVVDNGLVLLSFKYKELWKRSLNPYCSGQWSRTQSAWQCGIDHTSVLILIVVDNGLVQ